MKSVRLLSRLGLRLTAKQEFNGFRHAPGISKTVLWNNVSNKVCLHSIANPANNKNEEIEKTMLGKIERKLKLVFTCLKCNTRNHKIISKQAYEKGVVIARCDGCKNNHLIADNLGWFPAGQEWKNIEQILKAKGETVRRIRNDEEGYFEALEEVKLEERMKELHDNANVIVNSEINTNMVANCEKNANINLNPENDTSAVPKSENKNKRLLEVQPGKVGDLEKS